MDLQERAKRQAEGEPYKVGYFARKHDLTLKEARFIIVANGPSRSECDAKAAAFLRTKAARFRKWLR